MPSPRVQELIREGVRIALNPNKEWLDKLDRAALEACPSLSDHPDLAAALTRSNRATLSYFAIANLHNPGAAVAPQLGAETLRIARDLACHGLGTSALETYRIGHSMAWRRWTEIAFTLTGDPTELRELLEVPFRSANEFIDATLAGITAQVQPTADVGAERRTMVELILDDAPIDCAQAEALLGYLFDRSHTAVILWCTDPNVDHSQLDRATEVFSTAVKCPQPLIVAPDATTRWVWVAAAADLTPAHLRQVLANTPEIRLAIGPAAASLDGFRRSHIAARTTERMLVRLQSPQQIAFFSDIHMIALLTENPRDADGFIKAVLGDFQTANPVLHESVQTYLNSQCNAARAAKRLYTHRNTLLYRLEAAQRLLPRPLDETIISVAAALEILRWCGNHADDSTKTPARSRTRRRVAATKRATNRLRTDDDLPSVG